MDLDFTGKRVLVVGGASGIGNGIAHGFRTRGAKVAVWATRATAADYDPAEGSDLSGLAYTQVDASDADAVENAPHPFADDGGGLDILVLAQGTVLYRKGEFEMDGFRKVVNNLIDFCGRKPDLIRVELARDVGKAAASIQPHATAIGLHRAAALLLVDALRLGRSAGPAADREALCRRGWKGDAGRNLP
jgi:NAD(P)-dependent dehydrogenase (short-subunit alcohol dehydrogenase family)